MVVIGCVSPQPYLANPLYGRGSLFLLLLFIWKIVHYICCPPPRPTWQSPPEEAESPVPHLHPADPLGRQGWAH